MTYSCVYTGRISHTRVKPVLHRFNYPYVQVFLDLDEVDDLARQYRWFSVDRFNLTSFYATDFLEGEDALQLKQKVIDFALEHHSSIRISRVQLLFQPRILGMIFNPLSLFYCFDENDEVTAVVAEVHNTPWNERHRYFIPADFGASNSMRFMHQKDFHVSPFNPLNMIYRWQLSRPSKELNVQIDARLQSESEQKHFLAAMRLRRRSINQLTSIVIRFPFSAVTTLIRIYAHAAWLYLVRRLPFFDHPSNSKN